MATRLNGVAPSSDIFLEIGTGIDYRNPSPRPMFWSSGYLGEQRRLERDRLLSGLPLLPAFNASMGARLPTFYRALYTSPTILTSFGYSGL